MVNGDIQCGLRSLRAENSNELVKSMRVARCFFLDLEIVFSFRIEHSAPVAGAGAGWRRRSGAVCRGVTVRVRVRQIQIALSLHVFAIHI